MCIDQGVINRLFSPEVSLFLIQSSRSTGAEYLFLVENAWFSKVFLVAVKRESLLCWSWKTLKTCQTQCLDIIVLRIYFSQYVWLLFLTNSIEVVYSNLISLIKSMRAWNSCSGVVEMYQLVELIGDCVLGVSSKLSGMSLAWRIGRGRLVVTCW